MPSSAQLGPMTEIPTTGDPGSGTERLLRWLWRASLAALAVLILVFAVLIMVGPAPYKSGDDIGYYLGLVGGVMMLSLLLYPLRKRLRIADRLGPMRYWFRYHMVAGILGPLLILFHTTFRLGSMNGSVAFFAMVLVAISGIVGRFLYRHIHRGMYGQHITMEDAERDLRIATEDLRTVFAEYPRILERLLAFREFAFTERKALLARLRRFVSLKFKGRRLSHAVREQLKKAMRRAKREQRLSKTQRVLAYRLAKQKVESYIDAVCEASQLSSWERLFSLWHVIHIPFLYLLVISGIVHVVAVHMY